MVASSQAAVAVADGVAMDQVQRGAIESALLTRPELLRTVEGEPASHCALWPCLPMGCLVASAELVDCIPVEEAADAHPDQIPFGDFSPGRWAHIYEDIRPLDCRPLRGRQRFFYAEI